MIKRISDTLFVENLFLFIFWYLCVLSMKTAKISYIIIKTLRRVNLEVEELSSCVKIHFRFFSSGVENQELIPSRH